MAGKYEHSNAGREVYRADTRSAIKVFVAFLAVVLCGGCGHAGKRTLKPWDMRPGMDDKYYVWRNLVPRHIERTMDSTIRDKVYVNLLQRRAAKYELGAATLRLFLDENAIVDIGSRSLNSSNTAALLNLEDNSALAEGLLSMLRLDRKEDMLYVCLVSHFSIDPSSSKRRKELIYSYSDQMLVTVVSSDLSRLRIFSIRGGAVDLLSDSEDMATLSREEVLRVTRKLKEREEPFYGGYHRVLVERAGSKGYVWKNVKEMHQLVNVARETRIPPVPPGEIRKPRIIVPFEWRFRLILVDDDSDSEDEEADEEDETASANISAKAATSMTISLAMVGSVVSGVGITCPPDCDDQGNPLPNTIKYGPESGFNDWPCNNFCTEHMCKECCGHEYDDELLFVGGIALSCHLASDWNPLAHAGCGVVDAILLGLAWDNNRDCKNNCGTEFSDDSPGAAPCGP